MCALAFTERQYAKFTANAQGAGADLCELHYVQLRFILDVTPVTV
jgi:hypothetical protein